MAESVSENGNEAHPPGRYGRTTTEHLPALLRPFRLCPVKTPLKSELSKFEWQWCFDFSEKQLKIGSAPFSLRLKNIFWLISHAKYAKIKMEDSYNLINKNRKAL